MVIENPSADPTRMAERATESFAMVMEGRGVDRGGVRREVKV